MKMPKHCGLAPLGLGILLLATSACTLVGTLPPEETGRAGSRGGAGTVAPPAESPPVDSLRTTPDTPVPETTPEDIVAPYPGAFWGITPVSGVLGLSLSAEGPPGVQQLSREIREGVEVALADPVFRDRIRLALAEDRGTPAGGETAVRALEGEGAMAILGPMSEPALGGAARGRQAGTLLLSPSARIAPPSAPPVQILAGVDPEASRALARLVLREGLREVVVFHRGHPEEEEELQNFREAFESVGGRITRTFPYRPGTTSFEEPLRAIARLAPQGLVVIVPPEDLELVAPQLTFFEVRDNPNTRVFGSSAWSGAGVLQAVPPRHTEGILTVTVHAGEGFGPDWERFVLAYEAHFQRTLRSPVPALGWDATRLLLEAAARGGANPQGVARGLETLSNLPGATGTFSWRGGRISRNYIPVRIENRIALPLDSQPLSIP
jgi:ABC-type branched-subunit amino acid transport system substrate-binding protein